MKWREKLLSENEKATASKIYETRKIKAVHWAHAYFKQHFWLKWVFVCEWVSLFSFLLSNCAMKQNWEKWETDWEKKRWKLVAIFKLLMCVHVHLWTGNQRRSWHDARVRATVSYFWDKIFDDNIFFGATAHCIYTYTHTHFPIHYTTFGYKFHYSVAHAKHRSEQREYLRRKWTKINCQTMYFCVCVMFVYSLYHVLIEMIYFSYAPLQRMSSFLSHFILVSQNEILTFFHCHSLNVYVASDWSSSFINQWHSYFQLLINIHTGRKQWIK